MKVDVGANPATILLGTLRALILLRAYFDESGIHGRPGVTVIGGFVGSDAAWGAMGSRWQEILGNYGIKYFHMTDALSQEGEFRSIQSWMAQDICNALAKTLQGSDLNPVWSGIDATVWSAATTPEFRMVYPKPYDLCFLLVLDQLESWKRITRNYGHTAMVFATQNEYESRSHETLAAWQRYRKKKGGSLKFMLAAQAPALQAADMLVHELYVSLKSLDIAAGGEGKITLTPLLHAIASKGLESGGFVTKEALKLRVANRDWVTPYFPCPTSRPS
jgi:hypothetical protein